MTNSVSTLEPLIPARSAREQTADRRRIDPHSERPLGFTNPRAASTVHLPMTASPRLVARGYRVRSAAALSGRHALTQIGDPKAIQRTTPCGVVRCIELEFLVDRRSTEVLQKHYKTY